MKNNFSNKINSLRRGMVKYTGWIIVAWTLILAGLLFLEFTRLDESTQNLSIKEARTHFKKDEAFRLWAATHGGFYVPTDERTQPNPNLSHISERDIETPAGVKLTLMNPAWALRQLNEDFAEIYGVSGHITSLKTLRPENAPDDWERLALELFEKGETEVLEFAEFKDHSSLRLMQPLITQKGCLKCHAHQGYRVGDVRGGISVTVPIASYLVEEKKAKTEHMLAYILIWLLGFGVIIQGSRVIKKNKTTREVAEAALKERLKELKKYQQHLEELVEERTSKLQIVNKELEAFSYTISHDLRAPLRAIDGFTNLLIEDYASKLDEEGKRLGSNIHDNAMKMSKLIDDLLSFSRVESASMTLTKIDMKNMVNDIYQEATSAEERKRIKFSIADLPQLEGDTNLMHQVWMNLISNAVKYSSQRKQAVISVTFQEEKNKIIYCIKDNGTGFNMKYVDKLFGVFERLHSEMEFKGTGIGLSLIQRIIHRHDGKVWAEGKLDKGASFYFSLPK